MSCTSPPSVPLDTQGSSDSGFPWVIAPVSPSDPQVHHLNHPDTQHTSGFPRVFTPVSTLQSGTQPPHLLDFRGCLPRCPHLTRPPHRSPPSPMLQPNPTRLFTHSHSPLSVLASSSPSRWCLTRSNGCPVCAINDIPQPPTLTLAPFAVRIYLQWASIIPSARLPNPPYFQ